MGKLLTDPGGSLMRLFSWWGQELQRRRQGLCWGFPAFFPAGVCLESCFYFLASTHTPVPALTLVSLGSVLVFFPVSLRRAAAHGLFRPPCPCPGAVGWCEGALVPATPAPKMLLLCLTTALNTRELQLQHARMSQGRGGCAAFWGEGCFFVFIGSSKSPSHGSSLAFLMTALARKWASNLSFYI